jgi:hypothetical protein
MVWSLGAGDAHEARGRVGLLVEPAGLPAEAEHAARGSDRPSGERVAGEIVPDQQCHRLAEIERRLAGRAEEIAGVEIRHGDLRGRQVGGEHDPIG